MHPTRLACLPLLLSMSLVAAARDGTIASAPIEAVQSTECAGRVFLDRDGNGRMDRGETGLPGVAISDGERISRSDATGHYRLTY